MAILLWSDLQLYAAEDINSETLVNETHVPFPFSKAGKDTLAFFYDKDSSSNPYGEIMKSIKKEREPEQESPYPPAKKRKPLVQESPYPPEPVQESPYPPVKKTTPPIQESPYSPRKIPGSTPEHESPYSPKKKSPAKNSEAPVYKSAREIPASGERWTIDYDSHWSAKSGNCEYKGKAYFYPPEKDGHVKGEGPMKSHCRGNNYELNCTATLILDGSLKNGLLTFIPRSKLSTCVLNGMTISNYQDEHFNVKEHVSMPLKNGAQAVQDVVDAKGRQVWTLGGSEIERWRVTFTGYNVFYIKGYYIKTDQSAYGIKVHWRTVVDFTIKNGKFNKGSGKNSIVEVKTYSKPPGIADCITLKGSMKYEKSAFNVTGTATKSTAFLRLPGKEYLIGYTCYLDTDALKDVLKSKGYKKFPSLRDLAKTVTRKVNSESFTSGRHTVSLKNYEKVMAKDMLQGYRIKVRKIH